MCGRYASTAAADLLARELDALDETDPDEDLRPEEAGPNYNVAPTTRVLTVVSRHDHGDPDSPARRRIRRMRWGLVPHWTKPQGPGVPVRGKPLFNARADTAATTASFRDAVATKRCLIPMDGWYEWRLDDEPGKPGKAAKTSYYFTPLDGTRLYVAGLWAVWRDGPHPPLLSATILTTDAVGAAADVHERMPLVLSADTWTQWLDPDNRDVAALLATVPDISGLEIRPVSDRVNSVKNNAADLLAPLEREPAGEQFTLL